MKRIKILLLSHSHSGLIFSQPPPIYYRINLNPLDYSQVHHHQEIYYLSHQQQPVFLVNLTRICLLQALPPISLQQAKVQVFWVEVNLPQNRYSEMQPLLSPKNKMKKMEYSRMKQTPVSPLETSNTFKPKFSSRKPPRNSERAKTTQKKPYKTWSSQSKNSKTQLPSTSTCVWPTNASHSTGS